MLPSTFIFIVFITLSLLFLYHVGHIRWNYQLEDGRCVDSMALVTAKQYGIDDKIVQRAAQLATTFDSLCRPDKAVSADSVGGSYIESEGGCK